MLGLAERRVIGRLSASAAATWRLVLGVGLWCLGELLVAALQRSNLLERLVELQLELGHFGLGLLRSLFGHHDLALQLVDQLVRLAHAHLDLVLLSAVVDRLVVVIGEHGHGRVGGHLEIDRLDELARRVRLARYDLILRLVFVQFYLGHFYRGQLPCTCTDMMLLLRPQFGLSAGSVGLSPRLIFFFLVVVVVVIVVRIGVVLVVGLLGILDLEHDLLGEPEPVATGGHKLLVALALPVALGLLVLRGEHGVLGDERVRVGVDLVADLLGAEVELEHGLHRVVDDLHRLVAQVLVGRQVDERVDHPVDHLQVVGVRLVDVKGVEALDEVREGRRPARELVHDLVVLDRVPRVAAAAAVALVVERFAVRVELLDRLDAALEPHLGLLEQALPLVLATATATAGRADGDGPLQLALVLVLVLVELAAPHVQIVVQVDEEAREAVAARYAVAVLLVELFDALLELVVGERLLAVLVVLDDVRVARLELLEALGDLEEQSLALLDALVVDEYELAAEAVRLGVDQLVQALDLIVQHPDDLRLGALDHLAAAAAAATLLLLVAELGDEDVAQLFDLVLRRLEHLDAAGLLLLDAVADLVDGRLPLVDVRLHLAELGDVVVPDAERELVGRLRPRLLHHVQVLRLVQIVLVCDLQYGIANKTTKSIVYS